LQTIDYIILGSYLLFLMAMGPVFRSFSRSASDFFRAGGTMLWWAAGCAVIMGGFSAWSFTGGAARAYETGLFFCVLFACNFVATIFQYWLAPKFRQMRVVTAVEAIRNRFGSTNEQVFTWITVPIGLYTI
jgi:solute:Na+ symporter, SSS family